jgi:monothiol glutaredoxin
MTDELRSRIDRLVREKRIVIFMKGTPAMPMCGFSAAAVKALREAGAGDLASHDVLQDAELREGIKEYSSWPTIPQVYIDGKFVGGADIVRDLSRQGELTRLVTGG